MREQLIEDGAERLADAELIAVVLGTRGTEVARAALAHCGGLRELARASPLELAAVTGVGPARATRLAAAFALGRRAVEARCRAPAVAGPEDVFARAWPRVAGLRQEVFVALGLDARNRVVADVEVARGHLTGVEVHPREVFRPLIRAAAATAVVVHNHPSGDPAPSADDIALTERLRAAGDLIGIPLVDHVVVGDGAYVSLAERGWR